MDQANSKRQLAGVIDGIQSRLKSLWRVLSSLRLGLQLGMVISGTTLRVCLVRRRLHRSHILDVATFPLDPMNTGNWAAQIEAAASITLDYLGRRGKKRIPINIGLLGEDIAFRRLNLPVMPRKELDTAIKWEGEKLFPYEFRKCVIDYQIVGKKLINDAENFVINIVAADISLIEVITDRFEAAGLKVGQIGFLPSFMASVQTPSRSDADHQGLIVHLDDQQSMAIFIRGGIMEFYQQFVTRPQTLSYEDSTPTNLESIAAELSSFIDLYNGQASGNIVETVILSGKFASDEKTRSFLAENTGLPCLPIYESLDLSNIVGRLDTIGISDYLDVIVTGLANPANHHLVPEKIKHQRQRIQTLARTGVVAGLALLTAGAMQVQLQYRESHKESDLQQAQAMVRDIEQSPGYQGFLSLMGKLNRSSALVERERNHQESHFHLLLKELTLLLPDHVNLTTIDFNQKDGRYILQLDGHVRLEGFSPEIILAGYVESLEHSPFFGNVTVFNHQKRRDKDRFDLTFQLRMDARV